MATQPSAVAEAPVQQDGASVETNLADALYPDESQEVSADVVDEIPQDDIVDGDQTEVGEPDTAIDPPSSWDKEAKGLFSQLPPELQTVVADREAQRDKQVFAASERAAEAQRQATAQVAAQTAEAQQFFAQQLESFANAYLPPEPNPAHYQDMQSYGLAKERWNQDRAQHQQLMQQVQGIRSQAEQQAQADQIAMLQADAQRVMVELPELSDQAAYGKLVQELTPIAKELGYDDQRISQAWPSDVLAMKKVANYKSKADKWDALQARKMEGVRNAKAIPRTAKPGTTTVAQPSDTLSILYPNDVRKS